MSPPKIARPQEFLHQLKLDDIFLFPYVLAVVWQYFWSLPNRTAGWTLTAFVSLGIWYVYVLIKPRDNAPLTRWFWAIVVPPLVFIFVLRVLVPDTSWDVLNYHLFHSERALRGPLLIPGDFFPTPAPFNPAPDILTGLYRLVFGYRLGTIANLIAVVWLGIIMDRLLRYHVSKAWLRSVCVLLILCTEQIFFQINNYMVDLLTLPLLLAATLLAIRRPERASEERHVMVVALLLGISITFKLANIAFAIPIALICVFNLLRVWRERKFGRLIRISVISLVAAVAPIVPFSIFLYRRTGSPVFPLYNAIFKSPFWRASNIFDPRWGPKGFVETLLWPILVFFKPERFCEFPVYSGRLSLGFIAALVCIPLAKKDPAIRGLCIVTVVAAFLWSAASGYSRYGIFIELTSGAILVWLTVYLWKRLGHLRSPLRWLPSIAVTCLLLAQAAMALAYSAHHEWSTRPTLLTRPENLRDAKLLLSDRNVTSGLSDEERAAIANVDVWVTSNVKTTAFMGLLRPDIPVINSLQWEYVSTRTARTAFNALTNAAANRRLYSLCFPDDMVHAREALESRGLTISSVQSISVPFFSPSNRIALNLLRISRNTPIYRAQISLQETPTRFAPNEKKTLTLRIKNTGTMLWRAYVSADGRLQVNASNTWLAEDGETVINDMDARTALPHDLKSGEEVELQLNVTAPRTPGNYILEIDMVHEGVAFFYEKNSEPLRLNVRVGP
ncbi:MAG TPA: NBR1-Ig-like domain-containing protein [Pyrinomonadaceae bacterium]|nr:NBR1-Ig-like domain-containing protein [Pyrinomonadaceae bacterium]